MANAFSRQPVKETTELARVRNLPRRDWRQGFGADNARLVEGLTLAFRRPGGSMVLRPMQAAALSEMYDCGGCAVTAGVGEGKTLITFLAQRIFNADRSILFIPAKLRDKTQRECRALQQEWVFKEPRIESYEQLSRAPMADPGDESKKVPPNFLEKYQPTLVICDEAHRLRNPSAAVTRRMLRFLRETRAKGGQVVLVLLSGTFTRKSLMDYWHLFRAALGDDLVPFPTNWNEAQSWAGAIDSKSEYAGNNPAGLLLTLCTLPEAERYIQLSKFDTEDLIESQRERLAIIRGAYMRRLTETPGVIATVESSIDCSLYLNAELVKLPGMRPHFERLRGQWETPDGHPFSEAVELWRHARELACGFYYRWNPRPPEDWLQARRAWAKFIREVLSHSRTYDSDLQVYNAVMSGAIPYGQDILGAWNSLRDTFKPNNEAVWLDDTLLQIAKKWLDNNEGICWVEHTAFGKKLAELSGRPFYGGGGLTSTGESIEVATGPIIASIAANAEGRNLQRYSANLVPSAPPSGAKWEQLIGRTHRPGQNADEVTFQLLFGCREQLSGFEYALKDAEYIQRSVGQPQKLLRFADITLPEPDYTDPAW